MPATIAAILRYPVKGLSAEALPAVGLTAGEGLPHDRRFALTHGQSRFDPAAPAWVPKTNFLVLVDNERLALLDTRFDPATGLLTLRRDGALLAQADITTDEGRDEVARFVTGFMGKAARGQARLVEAPGHMFSDAPEKLVSILGLASCAELAGRLDHPVDPIRFRANLLVEGLDPWAEFGWIGRELAVGGARLRVVERIQRCAATNVDPATAARDMNIPLALRRLYGHADCGIYAEVLDGGAVDRGAEIRPL